MRTTFIILTLMALPSLAHTGWYTDSLKDVKIVEIRGETADTTAARAAGDRYVQDNLDYILANNEWVAVNFCAYWCGDCNNFMPDFIKAAKSKEFQGIRWAVADVDGVRGNESFRKKFNLLGTPTVILFKKGEVVQNADGGQAVLDGHKGDKDLGDLRKYLKSHYEK